MPVYCFRDKDDNPVEICLPYAEMAALKIGDTDSITWEGETLTRDIPAEQRGYPTTGDMWPLHSIGAGVPPGQIELAKEKLRRKGVDADYDKHGRVIFRSKAHRNAVLKAKGMFDADGGYGDRTV